MPGDGLTATELAEYNDPAGFALPINIMITDQTGEAALVTIAQDGRATYRAAAATLSAKCWKDGTAEPAFASGVDASYTAGRVGIQTVQRRIFVSIGSWWRSTAAQRCSRTASRGRPRPAVGMKL